MQYFECLMVFIFSSYFHSLYPRAAKEKHIVLLSVRFNGGMWLTEVIEAPVPLLYCTLPCSPGIFFFSLIHICFLSYTITCEHTCLCVHHAISLHVNGNPGNLLTSPSDDHSLISRRDSVYPISPLFIQPIPLCLVFHMFCSSGPV